MKTFTAGEGPYAGDTGAAIQRAVDDAAAAGGGTVVVAPGVYRMHDALHLRSRVRVVGRPGAVLRKVPSATSPILDYLGYGHYEITVVDPDKFPVGTGVHILDDNAQGFYTTVATVIGRDGELLFISRMLNHDYRPSAGAKAVSVYPIIEAEGVEDAAVEDLAVDGNAAEETFRLNGCRGAGVFVIGCRRVALRGLDVSAYRGDGVSFQQSVDVVVERCHVHDNIGGGLHPGSGTVRYVMQGNRACGNGECGIFYCLRTSHSICRDNEIRANGREGISVGERDTDHLIEGNRIAGNALEGIGFRPPARRSGDRTIVSRNEIGPNGAREPRAEVSVPTGLADVHVLDNTFTPGPGPALGVEAGCRRVSFAGNTVAGRPAGRGDVAGAGAAEVLLDRPKTLPPVGPAALPPGGARHLHIEMLHPWDPSGL